MHAVCKCVFVCVQRVTYSSYPIGSVMMLAKLVVFCRYRIWCMLISSVNKPIIIIKSRQQWHQIELRQGTFYEINYNMYIA